jgi:hypothetical protein
MIVLAIETVFIRSLGVANCFSGLQRLWGSEAEIAKLGLALKLHSASEALRGFIIMFGVGQSVIGCLLLCAVEVRVSLVLAAALHSLLLLGALADVETLSLNDHSTVLSALSLGWVVLHLCALRVATDEESLDTTEPMDPETSTTTLLTKENLERHETLLKRRGKRHTQNAGQ